MLVGEPGIGKTRTTMELETYARMRGAQVYWGRADESAGAPPYRPWLQVARSYRDQNPAEVRREEWGEHAVELQRIFPALRDLFPNLAALPDTETEEGQYRLFEAMADFVRGVSARIPLLIVLDDLHWSDRATLQMLTHLAREIARSRILVLGTYRDTDLDRTHPLSAALAELNREQLFTRVPLRGLARDEVANYIRAASHTDPPARLVDRIFEETEGNPFFLSEIVNLMAQEGTLALSSNRSVSDIAIPEGVKEALGRRLNRLSAEANALLTTLAVVGRECDHALAAALSEHDGETTLRLLEEALRGRVLEELGAGQYRFTHALMQETLLGELSATRQVQLHGRIAQAMEPLYGEAADQLPEIALHYRESAVLNREHADKAAHYAWLAGQQAASRFAWPEAARWYRICLTQAEVVGAEATGVDLGELLLRMGVACRWAAEWRDAWRYLMRAIEHFRNENDWNGFGRAASEAAEIAGPAQRQVALILEALEYPDDSGAPLWALLVGQLGRFATGGAASSLPVDYEAMHRRALLIARERGALVAEQALVAAQGTFAARRFALDEALTAREQEEKLSELTGMPVRSTPDSMPALLSAKGDLAGARAQSTRRFEFSQRRGQRLQRDTAQIIPAFDALNRGRIDLIDDMADDLRDSSSAFCRDAYALRLLIAGDMRSAIEALPPISMLGGVPGFLAAVHSTRAQVLLASGQDREGQIELDGWRDAVGALGALDEPVLPLFHHTMLQGLIGRPLETLDEPTARWLYHAITDPPFDGIQWLQGILGGIDTRRGQLALRFGELDEADRWFAHGVEFGRKWSLDLEVGFCLQGLAEVAERRGRHAEAMAHLDAAGELFSRHGIKLYLDQVLAKKQFLKA